MTTDLELGLVVSKPIDDGSEPADLFTSAGIVSNCKLSGNFTVQVSYDWQSIITPTFNGTTGTDLWIDFPVSGEKARVFNFSSRDGTHKTNACNSSTCPQSFLAPFDGEMKVVRSGEELTFYATDLNGIIVTVATFTGPAYEGPAIIKIRGRQGLNTIQQRDAMSISFDSLHVEAASYIP